MTNPKFIPNRLREYFPIILVLCSALALYLFKIGQRSLWSDEGASIYDAANLHRLHLRPLYYVILHIWMTFGKSIEWLRGLSALFALASVFLTWRLGTLLLGRTHAWIAALILTLSPGIILQAQEIRMYTLGMFLSLAGTLNLARGLEKPSNTAAALWALFRYLGFLTTPVTVLLLFADIPVLLTRFWKEKRNLAPFLLWLLAGLAVWAPYSFRLFSFAEDFLGKWIFHAPKPDLWNVFSFFVRRMICRKFSPAELDDGLKIFFAALLGTLCLLALLASTRRRAALRLTGWAFIPPVILAIFSHWKSNFWVDRYITYIIPYVSLLISCGFLFLWEKKRAAAVIITLIYFAGLRVGMDYHYHGPAQKGREDWRGIAQKIKAEAKPGDAILIIGGPRGSTALHYYFQTGDVPVYYLGGQRWRCDTSQSPILAFVNGIAPNIQRIWIPRLSKKTQHMGPLLRALAPQFPHHTWYRFRNTRLILAERNKKDPPAVNP